MLVTAFMPAVLVEIGFGTNPTRGARISPIRRSRTRSPRRSPTRRWNISSATSAASTAGSRDRREPPGDDRAPRSGRVVSDLDISKSYRSRRRHRRLRRGARPASCDLDALGGFVTKAVSRRAARGRTRAARRRVRGRDDQRRRAGESGPRRRAARALAVAGGASARRRGRSRTSSASRSTTIRRSSRDSRQASPNGHARAIDAFELNVSCPNTKAGGWSSAPIRWRCAAVVERARRETRRPLFVKLSPTLPNIGDAAQIAADAGADAISVVNTIPGLRHRRRAAPAGARLRHRRRERPGDSARRRARDLEGATGGAASDPGRRRRRQRDGRAAVHHGRRVARRRRNGGASRSARAGAHRRRARRLVRRSTA